MIRTSILSLAALVGLALSSETANAQVVVTPGYGYYGPAYRPAYVAPPVVVAPRVYSPVYAPAYRYGGYNYGYRSGYGYRGGVGVRGGYGGVGVRVGGFRAGYRW